MNSTRTGGQCASINNWHSAACPLQPAAWPPGLRGADAQHVSARNRQNEIESVFPDGGAPGARLAAGGALAAGTAGRGRIGGSGPHRTKGTSLRKVALAGLLWRHTTVSQSWLVEKMHLQSAANVSQLLRRTAPQVLKNERALPAALRVFLKSATLDAPS